jgi:hypothetical protein
MRFSVYYVVSVGEEVRFESVYEDQATGFAQAIYERDGIIAEIHEYSVKPWTA